MLFLNLALLGGLDAIGIPIIIHLLNRRSAKIVEWGAMRFLGDSVLTRKRRIQLEEALLMAARCLLVRVLALCVARPFVPPGSQVPWVVVLPLFLLGVAMSAVTTVMWPERHCDCGWPASRPCCSFSVEPPSQWKNGSISNGSGLRAGRMSR